MIEMNEYLQLQDDGCPNCAAHASWYYPSSPLELDMWAGLDSRIMGLAQNAMRKRMDMLLGIA